MLDWVAEIDIPSLVLGAFLGAVMSTWHSYYVKRPKLRIIGSGSGGGMFYTNSVRVTNSPGLLGLKLPETIIFGKIIHRHIEIGLVIDRSPAHECHAWLYDKQTNQAIKPLWWRTSEGKMTQILTLDSGQSADLMLFARLQDEPLKYFVYHLKRPDTMQLDIPDDAVKFDSTKEFIIEIKHSYGKKKLRTECKMTKGFDGRFHYSSQGGGGSF